MADIADIFRDFMARQPGNIALKNASDYEKARARMQERDKLNREGLIPHAAQEAQDISDAVPRRQ